jgi:hypothetical protein
LYLKIAEGFFDVKFISLYPTTTGLIRQTFIAIFIESKTYKKRMRNSVLKTVKIQILRIRFLKQSESISFIYNEKVRGL